MKLERKQRNTLSGMKAQAIKKAIDLSKLPPEPGLKDGKEVDAKNVFGCTRLIYRAGEGDVENMRKLISAGADVNARTNDGMTPLHWAVKEGRLGAVKLLISKGAYVNSVSDSTEGPLTQAVVGNRRDSLEIAKILIDNGANVNERGIGNHTPLFWAAMNGNASMSRFLMDKGAEFVATKNKETPLGRAASNAHADVIDLFLQRMDFSRDEIMHAYNLAKSSGRGSAGHAMSVIERYL